MIHETSWAMPAFKSVFFFKCHSYQISSGKQFDMQLMYFVKHMNTKILLKRFVVQQNIQFIQIKPSVTMTELNCELVLKNSILFFYTMKDLRRNVVSWLFIAEEKGN